MMPTLEFLEEGDSLIELSSIELVLVVGNTGAGKSTLVQFFAGSDSDGDGCKLESYKKGRSYLIRDIGCYQISRMETVSKSISPELVTHQSRGLRLYDCPGFSDTRNQELYIEVGNAFFMRKMADYGVSWRSS